MTQVHHYRMTLLNETVHDFSTLDLNPPVDLLVAYVKQLRGLHDIVRELFVEVLLDLS
nr:hypothetical protein [uncultured Duncaniella sp.]